MFSWLTRTAREPSRQPDQTRTWAFWNRIDRTTQEGNRALKLDAASRSRRSRRKAE